MGFLVLTHHLVVRGLAGFKMDEKGTDPTIKNHISISNNHSSINTKIAYLAYFKEGGTLNKTSDGSFSLNKARK